MPVLQDAFREAARREFASVPPEQEIDWELSDRFLTKMAELLSEQLCNCENGKPPIKWNDNGNGHVRGT